MERVYNSEIYRSNVNDLAIQLLNNEPLNELTVQPLEIALGQPTEDGSLMAFVVDFCEAVTAINPRLVAELVTNMAMFKAIGLFDNMQPAHDGKYYSNVVMVRPRDWPDIRKFKPLNVFGDIRLLLIHGRIQHVGQEPTQGLLEALRQLVICEQASGFYMHTMEEKLPLLQEAARLVEAKGSQALQSNPLWARLLENVQKEIAQAKLHHEALTLTPPHNRWARHSLRSEAAACIGSLYSHLEALASYQCDTLAHALKQARKSLHDRPR